MKYVAFLRGINSGRNPAVKMETLRRAFVDLGFDNVRTVSASGNVIFETDVMDETTLARKIEAALPALIGFHSAVNIRGFSYLRKLVDSNPFAGIAATPGTKPYVTFTSSRRITDFAFPVAGKGYTILGYDGSAVFSIVDLSAATTPDLMQVLDREFGTDLTTRSWGTINKILGA